MLGAFLLLAALADLPRSPADPSIAEIADDRFDVPAHDYRYVPAHIANWPATLYCSVEVANGSPVTIELISKPELGKFVRGRAHVFLVEMQERTKGEFRQSLPDKGDYDVLLENKGNEPSRVQLAAIVQFAREPDVAKYLSPSRRMTVILLSLLCFVVSVSWSAFTLVRGMKRT